MKKTLSITFILLLALLFIATALSQARQSNSQKNSVIVNTDLVITWGQVTNLNDGSPVKGLSIDDFLLQERGKQQQISLVKEGQPLSVVILVDGRPCVVTPEQEFMRSTEALRPLGEDAEIALMAWDSDVLLMQPFTKDQRLIADQLGDRISFFRALNGPYEVPRPEIDGARPGEAIYQAARYLEKNALPERRKIIIMIRSSWDRMAQTHPHTAVEVEELLNKTGTTVYALLENSGLDPDGFNPTAWYSISKNRQRERSGGTLVQFVDLTGGTILVSKETAVLNRFNLRTRTANTKFREEFDELFIKLTSLVRASYIIGYYPENTNFDGRYRRISLELTPAGKAKAGKVDIKARSGYRAMRPLSTGAAEVNSQRN